MEDLFGLEPAEVTVVIEWLAAMASEQEVKKRFLDFAGKTLTGKTIQKVSLRYGKQIRERNEAYLKNIKGNPLAHQRVRLDILYRVVERCEQTQPQGSFKISPEEYQVKYDQDNTNVLNAVKLAILDLTKSEELSLKKSEGPPADVEIDYGFSAAG